MKNNWQLVPVMVEDHQYNLEPNGLYLAIQQYTEMAFRQKGKREINQRAGGKSEVSGRDDMPLHASHFFHGKGEENQSSGNGFLATVSEHYAYHLKHRDEPENIGLNRRENEWALFMLIRNVVDAIRGKGGSMQDVVEEIETAKEDLDNAWKQYY